MKGPKIDRIASGLLQWYRVNARDLPWRRKPYCSKAYSVYVSEIMLQQTQVKTVIPYWERWMRELPSIEALAEAPEAKVLKLWEGLGYYSRARNLQKGAQTILTDFGGQVPSKVADLLQIPGIGRYTAGAISSIAFDQPMPIVDGNVIRVLSRVFMIEENAKSRSGQEKFWRLATELVESAERYREKFSRPCSSLNQGLMELGATICLPLNPRCEICPIARNCAARAAGRVHEFPRLPPRVATTKRYFVAGLFMCEGKFLVRQRPANVVNGGLWEFPNIEVKSKAAGRREIAGFAPDLEVKPLPEFTHTITRYRITVLPFLGETSSAGRTSLAKQHSADWKTSAEIEQLAFSSAHSKLRQMCAGLLSLETKGVFGKVPPCAS